MTIEVKFCRFYIKKTVFGDGFFKNSVIFVKKFTKSQNEGTTLKNIMSTSCVFCNFFSKKHKI